MNLTKITHNPNVKKALIKLGEHAPTIMTAIGSGLIIGASVEACQRTLKAQEVLEQIHSDMDQVEEALALDDDELYSPADARTDRIAIYKKAAVEFTKLYGAPILVAGVGFGLIFSAKNILSSRNAALGIAYSNLLSAYNDYRQRVIDTVGEDKEFKIYSGYKKEDIEYVDPESGETVKKKNAKVLDSEISPYARIFDEYNNNWSTNPASNLIFLRSVQNWANDKLQAEGVLFWNEVLVALGFKRCSEGQFLGWVFDPNNPNVDSYVDFGLHSELFTSEGKRAFLNGYNPCVLLDFNLDGVVHEFL